MSEKTSLENSDLALVLNRINALVERQDVAVKAVEDINEIPVLTEVYTGEPAALSQVQLENFPTLQQMANVIAAANQPVTEEVAERFLAEVQPLILKAVKVAVLEESVKAEKLLTAKLEQEITELLRKRLTSSLS